MIAGFQFSQCAGTIEVAVNKIAGAGAGAGGRVGVEPQGHYQRRSE